MGFDEMKEKLTEGLEKLGGKEDDAIDKAEDSSTRKPATSTTPRPTRALTWPRKAWTSSLARTTSRRGRAGGTANA
jgi:hypothetical protein